MNITVLGLWHLGCVTAACCARHYKVVGLDFDPDNLIRLNQGQAPLLEPGLNERLQETLQSGQLRFSADPPEACQNADLLWVAYDTPVNDLDESDVNQVLNPLRRCLPHLRDGAVVLVSSQLPAGSCRMLESEFPNLKFACSPENLRLGRALQAFEKADRVVVGIRDDATKPLLETLFQPFTNNIVFMRTESAEMVKHALNSFLALSIAFINEIARLCERMGADAREVAKGLKSDVRIGPKAYLGPGGPFAGGTLARDVVTLTRLALENGEIISIIPAIKQSNDQHRGWALRRLQSSLKSLQNRTIALLGLTYTPNTDTLRRSAAVELAQALHTAGATVRAYDPAVRVLPDALSHIQLQPDLAQAVNQADALVICTEWPQFQQADWPSLLASMPRPLIIDANGFLDIPLRDIPEIEHLLVGR